tara:strand:- start:20 stop:829 length:810 start_codon:yes stop_codon:yes gene_type:complete
MDNSDMETPFLIGLYKNKTLDHMSGFLDYMKAMDMDEIVDGYIQLRDKAAPQRQNPYFVESHNGIASSGSSSNRREEHLALALYNESRTNKEFKLPDGRLLEFIDYQTPLKAKQGDKGIGKIDLFGVLDNTLPTVIELKIQGVNGGRADSPLHALLEGLAYCAIIEKNLPKISNEASTRFGKHFSTLKPTLIVLAPDEYWKRYLLNKSAGNWLPEINNISNMLNEALGIEIILLAMTDAEFEKGLEGVSAKLKGDCSLVSVESIATSLK